MISYIDAFKKLKREHPEVYVKARFDYSPDCYCFVATKKGEEGREMDPFFAVNKRTGEVNRFSPTEDYPTFLKILQRTSRELNDKP